MDVEDEHGHWDMHIQNGQAIRTHGPDCCSGNRCCLHNPSDHHMTTWTLILRDDRNWLAERICEHGIGHPDPDSLAYIQSTGIDDPGVHGCCGCCRPPKIEPAEDE